MLVWSPQWSGTKTEVCLEYRRVCVMEVRIPHILHMELHGGIGMLSDCTVFCIASILKCMCMRNIFYLSVRITCTHYIIVCMSYACIQIGNCTQIGST